MMEVKFSSNKFDNKQGGERTAKHQVERTSLKKMMGAESF